MNYRPDQPLIVQSDRTVLLEVQLDPSGEVREAVGQFADLVKTPEHIYTYRMTPLTLWNAASSGLEAAAIVQILTSYSKFAVPQQVIEDIELYVRRYGSLLLQRGQEELRLVAEDASVMTDLLRNERIQAAIASKLDDHTVTAFPRHRGLLKQELMRAGFPVVDQVGYGAGESLPLQLAEQTRSGVPWSLRDYQIAAIDAFEHCAGLYDGSGVLVLPCGAGKTLVGLGAMSRLGCETLILTTNVTSVRQWKKELLDKTNLTEGDIGEYSGAVKEVRPVTIATYQILTYRRDPSAPFVHMKLFNERNWGLVIYDEVHLLPAPVFRVTADIQATRRLGLTATLVREDGREDDVFSLIGPKRYDVPWKRLEQAGWIAQVHCAEIRVPMEEQSADQYRCADRRSQFRIAGENPHKLIVLRQLLAQHDALPTLIIGQYVDQLRHIAIELQAPMISGTTPYPERERLFASFKEGLTKLLVVSKVANFAVDLPDAAVAIQVSGSYGSRQEEAQRLGRLLRPKPGENTAYYYSLVSRDTIEQQFAMKRQLFLVEQGYRYRLENAEAEAAQSFGSIGQVHTRGEDA